MNPAEADRSATAMAAAFILAVVGSTIVNFYARLGSTAAQSLRPEDKSAPPVRA
jgi:hypothetical protein